MLFLALLVLAVYSCACVCLGTALLRLGKAFLEEGAGVPAPPAFATAFLLGQVVWAGLWMGLLLAGRFHVPVIVAGLAVGLLAGARPAWRLFRAVWRSVRAALAGSCQEDWPWRIAAWVCVALVLLWGLGALFIPVPSHGDAVECHMAQAKLFAYTGRLELLRTREFFYIIGVYGELHQAALLALGAGVYAKAFAYPCALALLVLLLSLGSRVGLGRRGQWILLAIVLSSSTVTLFISDGKVDLYGGALSVGALYWALQTGGPLRRTAICFAGLLAGSAMVAKLTFCLSLFPPLVLLVFGQLAAAREKPWERAAWWSYARALLWLGVCMLPMWILHFLKNAQLYGEPFGPLFYFAPHPELQSMNATWLDAETVRRILWTYPLALTFGKYFCQYGNLSPLVLAFAPLALLLPRSSLGWRSPFRQVALAGLFGLVLWMVFRSAYMVPRYLLPSLLLLAVWAARAAEFASQSGFRPRAARLVICFCLLAVLAMMTGKLKKTPRQVWVALTHPNFVSDRETYRAVEVVNGQARPGERVFAATFSLFWLRGDLLATIQRPDKEGPSGAATPQASWSQLYRDGFRYLVWHEKKYPQLGPQLGLKRPDLAALAAPVHVEVLFAEQDSFVYRLSLPPPQAPPAGTP
jgi:hypothetical protein